MLFTVFFDSDVLIAGSASQSGASFSLLQLCELKLINGIINNQVLNECNRNLQKKLPDALPFFDQVLQNALSVMDNPLKYALSKYKKMAHIKDLPILVSAIHSHADYLVTFNIKHYHPDSSLQLKACQPGDLIQFIRLQIGKYL